MAKSNQNKPDKNRARIGLEGLGRCADTVRQFMDKSHWQIRPRFIAMLAVVLGIPFLAALVLPMLADRNRKARGNRANLLLCRHQMDIWKRWTTNGSNFVFWNLTPELKQTTVDLERCFDGFFQTNFTWQNNPDKREIVIVCGQQFDNVHKSGFWNSFLRNPAHVVGYSDGTTGLIPAEQFTNFNFKGFVSASSLATNSELKISGK